MKHSKHPPYILLDSGNGRKLEQAGAYRIIRPALNAFWKPSLPESEWNKADAEFKRDSGGGGTWTWKNGRRPDDWTLSWGGINLYVKPTQFGHLGFFAEQAPNWDWLRSCIRQMPTHPKTLNLFAYSGGATLAMSSAGAETCHLDASGGIIEWAKKNQALAQNPGKIRWICDDAMKFVGREQRRGNRYNGIVLDPPSFGRGAGGEEWKLERDVCDFLSLCAGVLSDNPLFVLLNSYTTGLQPAVLANLLKRTMPVGGSVTSYEVCLPTDEEVVLPCGASGLYLAKGVQL